MRRLSLGIGIYNFTRWILCAIFLYSGFVKLMDPQLFAILIEAYGLIPEFMVFPVAVILPILEIVAALWIFFNLKGDLYLTAGLLVLFMFVLAYGIILDLDVDCGCFGPMDPETEAFQGLRQALYRDLAMMVGTIYLYFYRFYKLAGKPLKGGIWSSIKKI